MRREKASERGSRYAGHGSFRSVDGSSDQRTYGWPIIAKLVDKGLNQRRKHDTNKPGVKR